MTNENLQQQIEQLEHIFDDCLCRKEGERWW